MLDKAGKRTWTTMIKLQMASMPRFPSTSRKSWPIGSGRGDASRSGTDAAAKEAAIKSSQLREAVAPTPMRMAMGAARAAPAVSSEMWAAESSGRRMRSGIDALVSDGVCLTSSQRPHWGSECKQESPGVYKIVVGQHCQD